MRARIFLSILIFLCAACPPAAAIDMPEKGVHKEYHPNGKVKTFLRFNDEKLVRRRLFYQNGRLMSDYIYKDGRLIQTRIFHENGRLKSEWSLKSGVSKIYNSEGRLIRQGVYP
ncbi:MAG: hypothetical protein Q8Q08_04355 [Candidatus Omnitrophota bacterium]|nr:hypothetical protein [Candidatus Omnitrophota bacterium]MDZ4242246.1 hypothetical protein [Candidatus Omnitrophota bacterium]